MNMGIRIDERSNPKQIGSAMYSVMKEWGWISGYSYRKKSPKQYHKATLPDSLKANKDVYKNAHYVSEIYLKGSKYQLPQDEVERYNWNEGLICAYTSVLFYALMREDGIVDANNMKYVQGFYKHKARADIPELMMQIIGGRTQIGIHAWVAIGNVVFDFTIEQQGHVFDLKQSVVIGDIPKGFEYHGYVEKEETVDKYIEMFAENAGLTPKLWILKHKIHALETMADKLRGDE
ncbi:hypothetical protein ACQKIY_25515 [Bacillus mycoides]|uniref:hypothetical protein n=1 Tax=Bacillus mycoides TaxID=1405 RepID=UPI003CFEEEBD